MPAWSGAFLSRIDAVGISQRLPVIVTITLVLLLAQSLALFTWNLLPQADVKENKISVARGGPEVDNERQYKAQIAQISQWHLFGEAKIAAPATPTKVTEAPVTRLNLKLLGVMASSDPVSARAIIADGKGDEDTYGIGKKLPGDAILREIYADRVILEYKGRLEMLRLPKESSIDLGFSSGEKLYSNNTQNSATQLPGYDAQPNTTSINNPQTSALLRQYREDLINNPESLMNLVSATPVQEEGTGKLKGYRINPGKDKALLTRFGLQNGDVITAVNGVELDNPIKALEIMRDLTNASAVSLDIERRGAKQSLSLQVD